MLSQKNAPKGWRRSGAASYYQFLRAKTAIEKESEISFDPPGYIGFESLSASSGGSVFSRLLIMAFTFPRRHPLGVYFR